MKKCVTRRGWVVIGLALGGLALVSCGTTRAVQGTAASAAISAQAERSATDMVVLDWQNRGIGEIAAPLWLLPAARGDWEQFRQSWKNLDSDKILKLGVANNAGRNVAMTIADVQYAARLANQLKQTVLTRAAISLGSDGEFDAVNDAATKTLVNIAGQERLTDFWQQIETTDEKGKKSTVYNYYVVYACDSGVWDQLVAKYLYDIIGVLPEKKTQQTMADLFGEINAEIKTQKPKTEAEFKAELAAQQQALAKPLSPAEQRAAYRSGESAKVAAASTTSADTDYVAALALLANSK